MTVKGKECQKLYFQLLGLRSGEKTESKNACSWMISIIDEMQSRIPVQSNTDLQETKYTEEWCGISSGKFM